MDTFVVERLETKSLRKSIQEFLTQSLDACQEGNYELMLGLAETARRFALQNRDQLGEAAALMHLGVAYTQMKRFDLARKAYEQARRIYHRDPALEQRYNEALASYGLASTRPQDALSQIQAVAHAWEILSQVWSDYVILGNDKQARRIKEERNELKSLFYSLAPEVYIAQEELILSPSSGVYTVPEKVGQFERLEEDSPEADRMYNDFITQHLAFQEALEEESGSIPAETIQAFIRKVRRAGAKIADVEKRDQLRKILLQWGTFIYEETDEYPAVQLAPFSPLYWETLSDLESDMFPEE